MERIWIYPCNRQLNAAELTEITSALDAFMHRWAAHKVKLTSSYELKYDQFIVLSVNEEDVTASGCSIDESVRFMRELDARFNLNLFDRMLVQYEKEGGIQTCKLQELATLYKQGEITDETPIFYNGVLTREEMERGWKLPLAQSGFARIVS